MHSDRSQKIALSIPESPSTSQYAQMTKERYQALEKKVEYLTRQLNAASKSTEIQKRDEALLREMAEKVKT